MKIEYIANNKVSIQLTNTFHFYLVFLNRGLQTYNKRIDVDISGVVSSTTTSTELLNAVEHIVNIKNTIMYASDSIYIPVNNISINAIYCIRVKPNVYTSYSSVELVRKKDLISICDNPIYSGYTDEQRTNWLELLFSGETYSVAKEMVGI